MKINIVYIDDIIQSHLAKYLYEFVFAPYEIVYKEFEFKQTTTYEDLLNLEEVRMANIIIIDSKLFENGRVQGSKFTGEEFKLILRKVLPFIEVIIVTAKMIEQNIEHVVKYKTKSQPEISPFDYYESKLRKIIEKSIITIDALNGINSRLESNVNISKTLVDEIKSMLEGRSKYTGISEEKLDEIIGAFKELKDSINHE